MTQDEKNKVCFHNKQSWLCKQCLNKEEGEEQQIKYWGKHTINVITNTQSTLSCIRISSTVHRILTLCVWCSLLLQVRSEQTWIYWRPYGSTALLSRKFQISYKDDINNGTCHIAYYIDGIYISIKCNILAQ